MKAASRRARATGTCSQAGPDRFDGTLTDAAGPVDVDRQRRSAPIRYKMKGGLDFDQQLPLQRGQAAQVNHVDARQKLRDDSSRASKAAIRKLD